jgi:hypothetical protein
MTERADQDPISTPAKLRQFAADYLRIGRFLSARVGQPDRPRTAALACRPAVMVHRVGGWADDRGIGFQAAARQPGRRVLEAGVHGAQWAR